MKNFLPSLFFSLIGLIVLCSSTMSSLEVSGSPKKDSVSLEEYIIDKQNIFDQKQDLLEEQFDNLGLYRWEFSDDSRYSMIFFDKDNNVIGEYICILIGSYSYNTNTWLWGWLNTAFDERMRSISAMQKEIGKHTGMILYEQVEQVPFNEEAVHSIVSMAVDYYDAIGTYNPTEENGVKYYYALIDAEAWTD